MNKRYIPRASSKPKWLLDRQREDFRQDLARRRFTHHVTLATNGEFKSVQIMRRRLKRWDARVNSDLLGGRWTRRPDERLFWVAFAEKLDLNPHWHLLLQVDDAPRSPTVEAQLLSLPEIAERHWLEVQPCGTIDVRRIDSQGEFTYMRAIDYATKALSRDENFDEFVLCREFWSQ